MPTDRPSSALAGFRLPFEAAALLRAERRLWGPAVVPFLLSLAAFAGALGLVIGYAGPLHELATGWMPEPQAARWYAWLWVGPARAGLALLGGLIFLALAGVCLVAAYVLASLLAAPFHDALSARVERVLTGSLDERGHPGLRGVLGDALRSLREELRRVAFFASVVAPLTAIGLLVPGAQIACGAAVFAFTLFFLPLDYASYALDRRRLSFRDKRRWLLSHGPVMAGFGLAAFLACAVPGLNLLAMPLLVVAGTLLAVRLDPTRSGGAG